MTKLKNPRVCYLEIPSQDPEGSAGFYQQVFGWNIRHRGTGRPSFDDATGNVSGAWTGERTQLIPYVWVDDINETLQAIRQQGGEVLEGPRRDHDPDGEWIAIFRDPAGNLIGLYQEDSISI